MTYGDYLANVGGALSMLLNAVLGGEYGETLSSRIGRSILRGGLAAHIPMPAALREHFERAADRV